MLPVTSFRSLKGPKHFPLQRSGFLLRTTRISTNLKIEKKQIANISIDGIIQTGERIFGKVLTYSETFTPVVWTSQGLSLFHEYTHLPWWLTVPVLAMGVRAVMIPYTNLSSKTIEKDFSDQTLLSLREQLIKAESSLKIA